MGVIDEVAIFSVALGQEDILEIVENGLLPILAGSASVKPAGKLPMTWGKIKID